MEMAPYKEYMQAPHTEYLFNLMNNPQTRAAIDKAMSTYPMYVSKNPVTYSIIPTREELNNKILNAYKYREIGSETVGRFLDELEIAMNEIMPYYYQLFKSEDIMNGIEDPFGNVDITETFEQETEGTSEGSSKGISSNTTETNADSETETNMVDSSKHVNNKTPQTQLNVVAKDIDSLNHATEVNWNKNESESKGNTNDHSSAISENTNEGESSNTTTGRTQHTLKKVGNQGVNTYAHDMKELQQLFRNIVQEIINDKRIQNLFYLVY